MIKNVILALFFLIGSIQHVAAQTKIEELLNHLPDVNVTEIKSEKGFESSYKLMVKQPLDHEDESKGFFYQKVLLSHRGFENPTVILTQGYGIWNNKTSELTELINGNQINVEHRFFKDSQPDSLDYHYLNLKQATADLHHIRQLLDPIYQEKWISSGISKGGATTVFYRYFYPNDVDISVPYVAPINMALEDPRIYDFLDTIGTDKCRNDIKELQIKMLENRDQLIPFLESLSSKSDAHYSIVPFQKAFEYMVMEFPFAFWQYGKNCDLIPKESITIKELATYFNSVSPITFFSDESIRDLTPHYYQSATQMGYYGYETYKFKDYLTELPTDSNPQATFFPFEMNDPFDGSLLTDVNEWLTTNPNYFLYIYGGIDTWTATGVPVSDLENSAWFILEGKHHGNARINEMNEADKKRFENTLNNWLKLKIDK